MKKITMISALGSAVLGGAFVVGCGNPNMSGTGGPGGYHSSSSEQNVGSRSSHGLYGGTVDQTGSAGGNSAGNAPATPYSQNQVVTPGPAGSNGAAGNGSDLGTSQSNSGSSSNGGTASGSGGSANNNNTNSGAGNSNGNTGSNNTNPNNTGNANTNNNNGSNANGPTNSNTGGQLGTPPAAPAPGVR